MARSKRANNYPPSFQTILETVIATGEPFVFPPDFQGYRLAGLRSTYQAYLKALVTEWQEAKPTDLHYAHKKRLGELAERGIVRIKDGQVMLEDRHNDGLERALQALLKSRGIKTQEEQAFDQVQRELGLASATTTQPRVDAADLFLQRNSTQRVGSLQPPHDQSNTPMQFDVTVHRDAQGEQRIVRVKPTTGAPAPTIADGCQFCGGYGCEKCEPTGGNSKP